MNEKILEDDIIKLPIQINGKLVAVITTEKNYTETSILKEIYSVKKVKDKMQDKKILKLINVKNKIINIIA